MAVDVTLQSLSPAEIAQAQAWAREWLAATNPSMDTSQGGVFDQLLLRINAQFRAAQRRESQAILNAQSILGIQADPLLADPAYTTALFSNYRIVRNPGAAATGKIAIIIPSLTTTPVAAATVFTAGDLTFLTPRAFVGVTAQTSIVDPAQQRLISRRADGTYAFVVDVVASAPGTIYEVVRNTRFTVSPAPGGLIDAVATQDFTGGADEETNAELAARFEQGLSPEVYSGRTHIMAQLRKVYPGLLATSIIGFGDPEMLRDRHNIFGASHGGKTDLYCRTAQYPTASKVTLVGTLVDADTKLWQITVDRDQAPGFYEVSAVLPAESLDQGTLEITGVTPGLDLTPAEAGDFVPEVANLIEGAFSRWQTAIVRFLDPTGDTTPGRSFDVYLLGMPAIADLQASAASFDDRNPNADYLVRAPVPAFCSLTLQVMYSGDAELPDADAIKQEIVTRVAEGNFSLGRLPLSVVLDAVHTAAPGPGVLASVPLDAEVTIYKPAGGTLRYRSSGDIVCPDLPDEGITSRTVVFLLREDRINLTIQRVPVLPV